MNTKRGSRVTRSGRGKTDWAKLRATPDSAIRFTTDAPRTSPEDWAEAVAHRGLPVAARKEQIALRVDAEVLAWFRAQGAGWQTRMNEVLKAYRAAMASKVPADRHAADAHKDARR
ncbi:MAG: BrnA antitoxin family protein [Deltaproteobacteria bacterium]|nr:BrnA antitoxin family protein [Deltaproteobacteria bacterium]